MSGPEISIKPLVKVPCAIIERDGRVLAAQRSAGGSLPMKWEFPGGKLEAEETEEEALVREIREELSVEISIGTRLPVTNRDDVTRIIQLVPFVCQLTTDDVILTEHEQILWLLPDELPDLDWAEADLDVLQNYFQYRVDLRSKTRRPATVSPSSLSKPPQPKPAKSPMPVRN
jgi:8-oxo-dGTP diphosphatase